MALRKALRHHKTRSSWEMMLVLSLWHWLQGDCSKGNPWLVRSPETYPLPLQHCPLCFCQGARSGRVAYMLG